MGHFNSDGSWTSNKGKTYGPNDDLVLGSADSQEQAADQAGSLNSSPFGSGETGGNSITGARIGLNAPGAQLDTGQADAQRSNMEQLISSLQQQAATGGGEWEKTLQAATDQASNTAAAVSQSNPSQGFLSSAMEQGNAQGAAKQRAIGQGNILRNESEVSAQGHLSDLLGGMGNQDIDQAAAQAAARQGLRETNLQLKQAATKNAGDYASGIGQAAGAASHLSDGGRVPGTPVVFGDDSRNDTVPAMLSPEEIVVPISAAHDPDKAAAFARAVARRGGARHYDGGGQIDPYTGGDLSNPYWAERAAPYQPGGVDPTGPKPNTFDLFGAYGDAQTPSTMNGGLLDTAQLEKTRTAGNRLTGLLDQRADIYGAGGGPSVAGQQLQDSTDMSIAGTLKAQQQRNSTADATRAALAVQEGGGMAAEKRGKEQSSGQSALAGHLSSRRQQELALAQAQQQAEMRNTMTNLGISAAQQQAIKGVLSGAGQAASSFSAAGPKSNPDDAGSADKGTWDNAELRDSSGEVGGATDLNAGDTEFKAYGGRVMSPEEHEKSARFIKALHRKKVA